MKSVRDRLAEKTIREGGCEVWTGTLKDGYGIIVIDGAKRKVHRVTWETERGPIPDGLGVLHTCDNRRCRKLAHLFLGDSVANNLDRHAKGRTRAGAGERHHAAALTWKEVNEIRASDRRGDELAFEYGVTESTISKIRVGRTWKPS